MMPLAARSSANCVNKQTKFSTWTPLNHAVINSKVFEERRSLLAKWFDKWSDSQRKAMLQDFVQSCSVEQLSFLNLSVSRLLPLQAADFTCLLPRALSLYLFSFLDPRSLCRCAQVSWHWKSIVDLDQLWMPKCVRLGWFINFSPTLYEHGIWKRHYIQTVQELRLTTPQTASSGQVVVPNVTLANSGNNETSKAAFFSEEQQLFPSQQSRSTSKMGLRKEKQPAEPPPWRDSDRCPKDTLRFNYLDNLDPIEHALKAQRKNRGATCHSLTPTPDGKSQKSLSETNSKLRKAKSPLFLSANSKKPQPLSVPPLPHHPQTQTRPEWACRNYDHPVTKETAKSLLCQAQWNATIRPGPVRSAVPQPSVEALRESQHSHSMGRHSESSSSI